MLFTLRVLFCVGLFYILYLQFPLESFGEELFRLRAHPLLLAMVGYFSIQLVAALRFYLALAAMEMRLPFLRVVHLHFVSLFFNMFLPGGIGGDAVKGYYLRASSGHWGKGFLAALLDRYLGLIGLTSLGLIAGATLSTSKIGGVVSIPWMLSVLFLVCAIPYTFNVRWVRGILRRLLRPIGWAHAAALALDEALRAARRPKLLVLGIGLTLAYYLGLAGLHVLMAAAFGAGLTFLITTYLIIVIALVSFLPIVPGAHGLRENTYVILFSAYGLTKSQSFLLAGLALVMLTLGALLGGMLYLLMKSHPRRIMKSQTSLPAP